MATTRAAKDETFMRLALAEARKGLGRTAPNPAVGAIVVRGGKVIAEGHHAKAGGPHAEVAALRRAGEATRGATLYTTLEPCDHHGRTPPCSQAILQAGIARVVFAGDDPNPLVDGAGVRRLRRCGVTVARGVLGAEADHLNRAWLRFMARGFPFVTLKAAFSLDGRLAAASGDARWVSGERSRASVHALRDEVDAILVGAGTVLADDPELTARLPGRRAAHAPLRVILDGKLRTPARAKVFRPGHLLVTSRALPAEDARTALTLKGKGGRVPLDLTLRELARRGVVHLLVEGGADVLTGFLEAGLWDELRLFVAPKLLGPAARPWFTGRSAQRMAEALKLGAVTQAGLSGEDAALIVERPRGRRL